MTVRQKLMQVLEDRDLSRDDITDETRFREDLHADSLDAVELVMAIEEAFDIEIPDEASEKFNTVGDVLKYLETAHGFVQTDSV